MSSELEDLAVKFTYARKQAKKRKKTIENLRNENRSLLGNVRKAQSDLSKLRAENAQLRQKTKRLEQVLMAYGFRFSTGEGWVHRTWEREQLPTPAGVETVEPGRMPFYGTDA